MEGQNLSNLIFISSVLVVFLLNCQVSAETTWLETVWQLVRWDSQAGLRSSENLDDGATVEVLWGIPDIEVITGRLLRYPIPSYAFTGNVENYQVECVGQPFLPSWLYFNYTNNILYGVPTKKDAGSIMLRLTACGAAEGPATEQLPHATAAFLLRVHSANYQTTTDDVSENLRWSESSLSERPCSWDEDLISATLILDADIEQLTAVRRVRLLYKAAQFMQKTVLSFTLEAKQSELMKRLLDTRIVFAGPGDADISTVNPGVELTWTVSCGKAASASDISQVISHNVESSRLTKELEYHIIGWHIAQTTSPDIIRHRPKRRANLQTGVPTPPVQPSATTASSTSKSHPSTNQQSSSRPAATESSLASEFLSMPDSIEPTKVEESKLFDLTGSLLLFSDMKPSVTETAPLSGIEDQPPILVKAIKKLLVQQGVYFSVAIPENTFYDAEDGDTRHLQLSMTLLSGQPLPAESPVQFNSAQQRVYGILLGQDSLQPDKVILHATDSAGHTQSDVIDVVMDTSNLQQVPFVVETVLALNYTHFASSRNSLVHLMERVARFYNEESVSVFPVVSVNSGSVVVAWTDRRLSKHTCEEEAIEHLYSAVYSDGKVNSEFRQSLLPQYPVISVNLRMLGVCLLSATTAVTEPAAAVNLPLVTALPIALVLVASVLAIVIYLLLCHNKKSTFVPEDETPIYSNNRKPVLLESELELQDQNQPRKPMVLDSDNPHLYNNPLFPPGVAESTADGTPAPPYVLPLEHYEPYPAQVSHLSETYTPLGQQPPPPYRLPPPYMGYPGSSDI